MRFFTNLSIPSFFFLLISYSTLARAARFDIINNCAQTATAVPVGGRQLDHGQTCSLDVPAGTKAARIWARTSCHFDGARRGSCETGDCATSVLGLREAPNMLAEFSLSQHMNREFIDISLVDGFNHRMEFSSTSGGCNRVIRCTAEHAIGQCPAMLKAPGGTVFHTNEYCCDSGPCGPTPYSRYFKQRCPDAYNYPKDDTATKACPGGANYEVVFCPR
ncbi:LOW QUALITY PROTEIN: hypothetical protein BT93_L1730 [Corymbia citriodora subsp. variegata]|uniref:Thaumatin-like protein n=1 Tax=Corymbia citriodora subsp. variegata TaxID=360336 RepID=A0A8T0CNA3_CORYI|nr:LOW QUALITY PROTEIN: hypothetical protein BT93_L1730 [Corymbia citriodora subsp. variegata]